MCIYMYTYIYIYMYTYTHTHVYIYIYIYICVCIGGGDRQAQTVSFCARRVSPDRRLVQARLARAKRAVATIRWYAPGRLVASHLGKTRELANYCGSVFNAEKNKKNDCGHLCTYDFRI